MIGPITAGHVNGAEAAAYEDAFQPPIPEQWPEPEDRGTATRSALAGVEYVEDLIRPGRIVVWAAEEGSGKSYTVDDELGIRVAVVGGDFAGTWPVLQTGGVLILSEMHADDDHDRETTTLGSLGRQRADLTGRYFRLPLATAANGRPALTVPEWCVWIVDWMREHKIILLAIDTATGATQVDPWGQAIQAVYSQLRVMLAEYPELAIVLIVHLKKPSGRGARHLTDVLGEWGRWNDVTVLQENDGASLERARITVRKRVRRERRIIATKAGGLLVDPTDATATTTKVPAEDVLAAVAAKPGITYAELGAVLGVTKPTATTYAKALAGQIDRVKGSGRSGPGASIRLYPVAKSPNVEKHEGFGDALATTDDPSQSRQAAIYSLATRYAIDSDDEPEPEEVDAAVMAAFPGTWVS